MTTDLDRLRTDAIIAIHKASDFDYSKFTEALDKENLTKEDMATMMGMTPQLPEYQMIDLSAPMSVASMKIPDYKDFMAGHTKISNNPLNDWMVASPNNQFGNHHPFGFDSNSCPLLHGASWGDPAYASHLEHAMDFLKEMSERERTIKYDKDIYGDPKESMFDLMTRDRNRYRMRSDEEYREGKKQEWSKSLGLLPYLFGLEYQTPEQKEHFLELIRKMANTEGILSPDSRVLQNKMQEKAGLSWGRAMRSFRARMIPILQWWQRASDRHGPVSPPMAMPDIIKSESPNADLHYVSPYINDTTGIVPSHTYHWWDLFQPWGGVGRDSKSLHDMLKQSYPKIFSGGWLDESLFNQSNSLLNQYQTDGGSHFPSFINANQGHPLANTLSSSFNDADFFERRRANWSHSSNLHFLHPSEVKGSGGRMVVPSDQMMLSGLGRSLAGQADMGSPRIGMFRENHPSSTEPYWRSHNALFAANDMHLGKVMKNMAQQVMKQFGPEVLHPTDPTNMEQSTLARGNLQQLASAADFAMKKMNLGEDYKALVPVMGMMGMPSEDLRSIGPVIPGSHATSPPVYNTGNTHLWGHEMPAKLTWKHDPKGDGLSFGLAEEPFTVMQRTVHENKIRNILPSLLDTNVQPKQNDIFAMGALNNRGLSPIATGSLMKASKDEYEPTGVFKTKIIPAYTIHKLEDMDKLRGFSGNWVVQKKPTGKRMFIEKKGNNLKNSNLPSSIKKDLRKINGDFMFDAYLDDEKLSVVDLLVHKGTDLHQEPLEDRVNALRTLYDSTENINFPMPNNCVSTDADGLGKAIKNFDDNELFVRDALSTFMKEKEVHPKWITYAKESISKAFYPPMPELIVKKNQITLCYPSIYDPVIVKGDFTNSSFKLSKLEGNEALFNKALRDIPLWGAMALNLMKEAVMSGDVSSPIHSMPKRKRPRKLKLAKETTLKAPSIIGEDEKGDNVADIMQHVRGAIRDDDVAKTTKQLLRAVKGLNTKMLEMYHGEYGIEKTPDGKRWTVNEAIDDDVIENMFPRMNRISPDGGAYPGLEGDITAPRGPTKLLDDSATTFYDPRINETTEAIPMMHLKVKDTDEEDVTIDVENGRATLRLPMKTQQEIADEEEVEETDRSEAVEF